MRKKTILMTLILGIGLLWGSGWKEQPKEEKKNEVVEKQIEEKKVIEKVIEKVPKENVEKVEKPKPISEVKEPEKEIKPKVHTREELEKQVTEKYNEKFLALKNEYEGKIDALLGEAKAEYYGLSEEERSKSKISLGFKYLKKGKTLEEECDGRFEAILGEVKRELKENNFSLTSAEEARNQYEEEKSARRKYLMDKVLKKKIT